MPSRIHRWMGPIQIQRSRSRGLWLPRGFSARGYKYPPLGILHLPIRSTKPLLCRIFSRAPAVLTPFAAFKPTRPATPVSLLPPFLISSVSFFFLSPAVVFAAASPNAPRERAENALSLTLPASSRRGGWRGPTLRAPSKPPDLVLGLRGLRRCPSYNLSHAGPLDH